MGSLCAISKSGQMGHEIPVDVIKWYDLAGDARGFYIYITFLFRWARFDQLKVNLEHILDKLTEDNISMDDVASIAEGVKIPKD